MFESFLILMLLGLIWGLKMKLIVFLNDENMFVIGMFMLGLFVGC